MNGLNWGAEVWDGWQVICKGDIMHELTRRFDLAYTRIEHQLKIICKADKPLAFYTLVENASEINPAVRQNGMLLNKFWNLRNLVVNEHELVIPSQDAVSQIEAIADSLERPQKLDTLFSMSVDTCNLSDSVGSAARKMHDKCFSQLPVVNGKQILGLLTTETITRWLAMRSNADGLLQGEPVGSVLEHQEQDSLYVVLGTQATIFDALGAFEEALHSGNDLDAILLTDNGSEDGSLLGILTPFDIPRLMKEARSRSLDAGSS